MRWPFRRRQRQTVPARRRDWARLPPMERVIDAAPPVLVAPGLPDVAGTRSPLPPSPRPGRGIVGRVTGLVTAVARVPTSTVDFRPAPAFPLVPRRLPKVDAPAARRVLTKAEVVEPQAPAVPFHSVTEFDRLVAQYSAMPIGDAIALAGFGAPPAPPPPSAPPDPPAASPPRPARPTLAESRRRGLDGSPPPRPDSAPAPRPRKQDDGEPGPNAEADQRPPRSTGPEPPHKTPPSPVSDDSPPRRADEPTAEPVSAADAGPPPVTPRVVPYEQRVVRNGQRVVPPDDVAESGHVAPVGGPSPVAPTRPTEPSEPGRVTPSAPVPADVSVPGEAPVSAGRPGIVAPAPPRAELSGSPRPAPSQRASRHVTPSAPAVSAPVYRAPVSPAPDVVATVVPAEVAGAVRAGLGIDVADVTVHRGRDVGRRAEVIGARAFTQQAQVFLPDEAGSLDRRDTQALLVHELVHAAQQRTFGADLPTEESADGRRLESEAVAAEQWFLGDGPPPVIERPPDSSGPVHHDQVQREPAPPVAPADLTEVLGRLDGLDTQVAALRDRPPAFDQEDARVLDRLAGRLYRYIRSRLRAELIVDRERSGLLADLSMRGVR